MKHTKAKIGLISIVLSIVLMAGCIMPSLMTNETNLVNPNENARIINAEKIVNTNADDFFDDFLDSFFDYDCELDYDNNGEEIVRVNTGLKLDDDSSALYEITMSKVESPYRQDFSYTDEETILFNIVSYDAPSEGAAVPEEKTVLDVYSMYLYYGDDPSVECEDCDENCKGYYLDNNGELTSFEEFFDENVIDNCVAITATTAVIAVAVAAYVIYSVAVVARPNFSGIFGLLRSFGSWLRRTVVSIITVKTVTAYNIKVFDRDYTLEKVDSVYVPYIPDNFYLAVVVKQDVYISAQNIGEPEAIIVLRGGMYINIDGSNFLLNTYTSDGFEAERIAIEAAGGAIYHNAPKSKKGVYFAHYHPKDASGKKYATHSFFGVPTIVT